MTPKFKMFQAVTLTEQAMKKFGVESMRGMVGIVQGIGTKSSEPQYIVRFTADSRPDTISESDLEAAE